MNNLLVALFVITTSGRPIPHALVQCAEIARQTDGPGDEKDWGGAVLVTDSRGAMFLSTTPGEHHCRVSAPACTDWEDTLVITESRTFFITLVRTQ